MQLPKSSITCLASEGKLTVQIPQYSLHLGPSNPAPTVNYPDDWFCELKNMTPVTGKQSGYLHLTEKGFKTNYNDLKIAFEAALAGGCFDRTKGVGWPAFVQIAKDHFAEVKLKQAKLIAKKQKEIAQLQSFVP